VNKVAEGEEIFIVPSDYTGRFRAVWLIDLYKKKNYKINEFWNIGDALLIKVYGG
jgi:hypothetical protein